MGGFDALGLRPRERTAKTVVTDSGSQDSSDQSAPVYHHYHHHFHHTQPHGRVPSGITENTYMCKPRKMNVSRPRPLHFGGGGGGAASLYIISYRKNWNEQKPTGVTLNINHLTILCKRPYFPQIEALILNTESY